MFYKSELTDLSCTCFLQILSLKLMVFVSYAVKQMRSTRSVVLLVIQMRTLGQKACNLQMF